MTSAQISIAIAVADVISRELDEDYVGLWKIPWHLRRHLRTVNDDVVQQLTEAILRGLGASGVRIGDLSESSGAFNAWPEETAIETAVLRWSQLGRDPNIGEIAWLARLR